VLYAHHVLLRDALRDAHDEGNFCLQRLQDGLGGEGRGHVDHRGVGASAGHGLRDGVENREPEVLGAALRVGGCGRGAKREGITKKGGCTQAQD
jgi:hypothetical protein